MYLGQKRKAITNNQTKLFQIVEKFVKICFSWKYVVNSTLTLNIVAMSSQVTKGHNHTYQEHTPEFECRGTPNWSEFLSRSTNKRINDLEYKYRTRAIISRGLYFFYPIFTLAAAYVADNLCTKNGNSSLFKLKIRGL